MRNFFILNIPFIDILIKGMIQEQEDILEDMQGLTLAEILERDDLCLEQIFSIRDIHNKIKKQWKIFIEFCKGNELFTDRLISLGLKCPMHESSNSQMKNVTYISADILTSDHEAIADLLILSNAKSQNESDEQAEIAQQIQTEDNIPEVSYNQKYKYLNKILDYIQGESLEENCINYITKSLLILVRKRLNAFLEYFRLFPDVLARLTQISHFPSVSHLLAKLITDDEENLTPDALEARSKIIPLLLQKIHSELSLSRTLEVIECLEQVLQSTRYSDSEERSELQRQSDLMVSSEELIFHINSISNAVDTLGAQSLNTILNSVTYLSLVIARMNLDEQQDFSEEIKPFKPTLSYQVQAVYTTFFRLIRTIEQIEKFRSINHPTFKLLIVKCLELLSVMGKHSKFGSYYELIPKDQRLNGIRILISSVVGRQFSGVLLQIVSSLIEKIILQQEKITESHPQDANKISPRDLYQLISNYQLHLGDLVHGLAIQTTNQRNRNQQGIYLRKLLVVFDNYFQNTEIRKTFPEIETVTRLFPTFTPNTCKQYADKATIFNHPGGSRAKTPEEFKFIQRNQLFLSNLVVDEIQNIQIQTPRIEKQEQQKKLRGNQMVFKLQGKIKTLKDRVKQKQVVRALDPPNDSSTSQKDSSTSQRDSQVLQQNSPQKQTSQEGKQISIDCPIRANNSPQPCLLFFIRHLAIY